MTVFTDLQQTILDITDDQEMTDAIMMAIDSHQPVNRARPLRPDATPTKRTVQSNRQMNSDLTNLNLWRQEPKTQTLRAVVSVGRTAIQWLRSGV